MKAAFQPKPAIDTTSQLPVSFQSLIAAEFYRARHTRSTKRLTVFIVILVSAATIARTVYLYFDSSVVVPGYISQSTDFVAFVSMLASAVLVARDHQTGVVDLVRTLTPQRYRHFIAQLFGVGLIALIAVGIVMSVNAILILIFTPTAANLLMVDTLLRTCIAAFLVTACGVGIGAATRSSAIATFTVISLYVLLPVVLMTAGVTVADWAMPIANATPLPLLSNAIAAGGEHWLEVGTLAMWTLAIDSLGLLREMKGN